MVEVSVQEVSVRMPRLRFFPDSREGRDRFTTIYSGDICPGNYPLVMGDSAPIYIEGRAELIQTFVK